MNRPQLLAITFVIGGLIATPVDAYINGGSDYTTLAKELHALKKQGWSVVVIGGENGEPLLVPEEQTVNQMIGEAIKSLPSEHREVVTAEQKRELARLLMERLKSLKGAKELAERKDVAMEGKMGNVGYRLGVLPFERIEVNYRRDSKGNAVRDKNEHRIAWYARIVALRIDPSPAPARPNSGQE